MKRGPEKALISGGLFIGIGVGLLLNQVAPWTLIGLGVGIIAAFIFMQRKS